MNTQFLKGGLFSLVLAVGVYAAPAFAGTDDFYANSAAWSVNLVLDPDVTSSFSIGANGSSTLNSDIFGGDSVDVVAGWVIKDNSAGGGVDTSYGSGRNVVFTASTTVKPASAPNVSVTAIPNCAVTSAASTCSTTISFSAPTTVGTYQVQIGTNGGPGPGPLTTKTLRINFTVAEDVVEMVDTQLTVDQQCFLLNDGDVDLTATLEELDSGDKISGADIDFELNASAIGTAVTDSNGVATLVHNINGLGVGDYNLYAEFPGDALYNPSNDSDTLGITYLFVGFGQPINGDGTSIFGGRVIPIKIRLVDANGNPVTDAAPTVWLTTYDEDLGLGADLEKVSSVSAADTGNIMRYVADDQQYIYNWDARSLANGTYAVVVDLGDSPTCRPDDPYAIITVAKKK